MAANKYERRKEKLAPANVFFGRMAANIAVALGVLCFCLFIGVIGYHFIAQIEWIDSIHNASMILSGMGPVVEIKNTAGKLFSSAYAIFSGVVFITNIGIILAPAAHRLIHRFHLSEEEN